MEYDGTDFYGWQYQPDKRTIQGEIERALKEITGEEIRVIGAGRTDQGVHALGQVANFKTNSLLSVAKFKDALNAHLLPEIYIKEAMEMPMDFHSRFWAKGKIYQYKIMTRFSPLKRRYWWFVEYPLDIKKMEMAMCYFIGERDFKNLSVSDGNDTIKNTICRVEDLSIKESKGDIVVNIMANRFLRRMARGIVGFLVDVGRGRFQVADAEKIFSQNDLKGIYFAPANGLCLVEVRY